MNQSLWQKFKRVKWVDFIHIIIFVFAIPVSWFYRMKHKELWLICDLKGEARDNGFWFFEYMKKNHPEIETIFAIDVNSPDYEKVSALGECVQFGSFRHWVMYLSAQHIISSQKASGPNATVCYVLDRFRLIKGNKIFLQHGIIKDDISFLYYKYTKIRMFTCSTQREYEFVRDYYGYPQGHVQLLGLCRFDELLKPNETKKQIVVMPTWRKWLSHPTEGISSKDLEDEFKKSLYYKKWSQFLQNQEWSTFLEEEDWTVVFYLHREAQKYTHLFASLHPRVEIAAFPETDVQQLLKESKVMITDYSSVAMDFALMDKPVIYYQFDQEEFREKHLAKGYYDYYQDGFGPICVSEKELLESIEKAVRGEEELMYAKRRETFFTLKDCNNCQRTYEAIKRIKG